MTHLPNLADDPGPFDNIINALAEKLFREQVSKGHIDQGLYDATAKQLLTAMHEGLGGLTFGFEDPRNTLKAFLEHNLHQFSAAKSLAELQHMRSLLFDGDKKRSFEAFRNACSQAGYQFNVHWLRTEYNTAVAATQAAAQWASLLANGTEVLEYSTVGDDKVRPAHQALDGFTALITDPVWNIIFPPNDWNCRCWVIPGNEAAVGNRPLDTEYVRESIPPLFRKNVGVSKTIFKDNHPYYKAGEAANARELQAVKNYGMMPVQKLYKNYGWPARIEFGTKAEANAWWAAEAGGQRGTMHVRDVNGVVVELDNDFRTHVMEKGRWSFMANVTDVLQKPDEVWSLRKKGELLRYYIKYYDGHPLVMWVSEDGGIRGATFVDMQRDGVINLPAIENLRRGVLIYRK